MEPRIGDPADLVPGRVQDGDLVRAEQADVEVARLREGETGGLWRRLSRVEWEPVDELEVRCRRVIDEPNPVDD